jgi:hypothetical protein
VPDTSSTYRHDRVVADDAAGVVERDGVAGEDADVGVAE